MFYISYEGPALKSEQVWTFKFESYIKFKVIKVCSFSPVNLFYLNFISSSATVVQ